ncbi:NEDD4-binding protein 1-like isoform X2 [Lissotriton helveticus]
MYWIRNPRKIGTMFHPVKENRPLALDDFAIPSVQEGLIYIKGLCTPEIDYVLSYPKDLHCIFLGAEGLFLNGLVWATCASISVNAHGSVKILGLAESVVMAQSLIQEFVDRYLKNLPLLEEHEVCVKRRFKQLVETHHDKHSMDLLILPSTVKEVLLDLVQGLCAPACRLGSETPFSGRRDSCNLPENSTPKLHQLQGNQLFLGSKRNSTSRSPDRLDSFVGNLDMKNPARSEDAVDQPQLRQVLRKRASRPIPEFNPSSSDGLDPQLNTPEGHHLKTMAGKDAESIQSHRELNCLQDNFPVRQRPSSLVGHGESIVLGGDTAQPYNLLEHPWSSSNDKKKENDCKMDLGKEDPDSVVLSSGTEKEFNMMVNFFQTMGYAEEKIRRVLSTEGFQEPSRILDLLQSDQECHTPRGPKRDLRSEVEEAEHNSPVASPSTTGDEITTEEEYILEVIKSAAKNCGYSPSEITEFQEGAPMANLLIKLNQRKEEKSSSKLTMVSAASALREDDADLQRELFPPSDRGSPPLRNNHQAQCESSTSGSLEEEPNLNATGLSKVCMNPNQEKSELGPFYPEFTLTSPNTPLEDIDPGVLTLEAMDAENIVGVPPSGGKDAFSLVTGTQRFKEVMDKPFQLNLKNEPGKDHLRHIIIDGSNVAMIHGLRRFFSCRGIAIAVQHFWDHGHRHVTVFVPQWRMKKDPKVKEQHFLTQLNQLSLLSFTPSRTVAGKRIASYDDRFLLQLAERTEGVIVTNDNLRDCAEESPKWKDIIKQRLLQFTFVGDIFMIPDDPLGRHGPSLDEFLSKTGGTKVFKSHSSVSHRTSHTVPRASSQTEIFHLRDRKAGGLPLNEKMAEEEVERSLPRGKRETAKLRQQLLPIFKQQEVDFVLQNEQCERDLNKISEMILNLKS